LALIRSARRHYRTRDDTATADPLSGSATVRYFTCGLMSAKGTRPCLRSTEKSASRVGMAWRLRRAEAPSIGRLAFVAKARPLFSAGIFAYIPLCWRKPAMAINGRRN